MADFGVVDHNDVPIAWPFNGPIQTRFHLPTKKKKQIDFSRSSKKNRRHFVDFGAQFVGCFALCGASTFCAFFVTSLTYFLDAATCWHIGAAALSPQSPSCFFPENPQNGKKKKKNFVKNVKNLQKDVGGFFDEFTGQRKLKEMGQRQNDANRLVMTATMEQVAAVIAG